MVQTDKNHLGFGRGKQACPGRYFAAAELKIMLTRILTGYEFNFVEGTDRPKSLFLDENCFPDPAAKLMLRRRKNGHPDRWVERTSSWKGTVIMWLKYHYRECHLDVI
ncbi:hypothetical protein BDV96DRAFT_560995, partial [Lophiotrema nucula]